MTKTPSLHLVDHAHRDNPADWFEVTTYVEDRRYRTGMRPDQTSVMHRSRVKAGWHQRPAYRLVTNLMTGQPYWEPSSTPHACSASSESYWSA